MRLPQGGDWRFVVTTSGGARILVQVTEITATGLKFCADRRYGELSCTERVAIEATIADEPGPVLSGQVNSTQRQATSKTYTGGIDLDRMSFMENLRYVKFLRKIRTRINSGAGLPAAPWTPPQAVNQ